MFDLLSAASGSHVAIMAYRDTAAASFSVAKTEYDYAVASAPNVKIWHGLETGPFDPDNITFHEEGPAALETAIDQLRTIHLPPYRVASSNVVAGVAIHAYSYYRLW